MALKLFSNVKQITSGQIPSASNLDPGEMAFGRISTDNKYHLYANSEGAIVDLVQEGLKDAVSLDDVLKAGNISDQNLLIGSQNKSILRLFNKGINVDDSREDNHLYLHTESVQLCKGSTPVVSMTSSEGFVDNSHKVLSANPDSSRNLSTEEQKTVRDRADVYSKAEVDALIKGLKDQLDAHIDNITAHPDMNVTDADASVAAINKFQF